ncbi:spore maturation protein A [Desulfitispora alkaliphila]|uniref:nucleoside recognition domain-containing protein n=1 Tax=Desulfitispora alkaliphila TaxID=622674 RepID=UPI003D2422DF
MINVIWMLLLVTGIITAAVRGKIEVVTEAAMEAAQTSVTISIEIIGVMALWLGIMKIAEKGGLINFIARGLRPVTRFLFPSIPKDHPAMGPIIMNISANVLGLGNAATPFGLKAMQELQKTNPNKKVASDAMCTFLALNTSCITILPATVLAIRVAANSANPTEIVGTTIFATTIGTIVALTADRFLRGMSR